MSSPQRRNSNSVDKASKPMKQDERERPGLSSSKAAAKSRTPTYPQGSSNTSAQRPLRRLEDMPYYHGVLPRDEINFLLQEHGDYIVRFSKPKGQAQLILSVMWDGSPKHFPIHIDTKGRFRLEGKGFPTVPDLIDYHVSAKEPVTKQTGAMLLKAVCKEKWEMNNDDVVKEIILGEGNFGKVWRGKCKDPDSTQTIDVAIKICHAEMSDDEKKKFITEARIMRRYDHPNIVRFIGVAAQKEPMMIILELMLGGGLDKYLQQPTKVPQHEKLKFCFDASKGMEYLETKKCIHRDLAARNCLLAKDKLLKIADFGMSREAEQYTMSQDQHMPIKWTALEALFQKVYTHKSDVWSFGILTWEIYNDGTTPYPGMNNLQAVAFLRKGNRLKPSEDMSKEMCDIMLSCWEIDPNKRPSFSQLRILIEKLVTSASSTMVKNNF